MHLDRGGISEGRSLCLFTPVCLSESGKEKAKDVDQAGKYIFPGRIE